LGGEGECLSCQQKDQGKAQESVHLIQI
jgi:hypothetical protein